MNRWLVSACAITVLACHGTDPTSESPPPVRTDMDKALTDIHPGEERRIAPGVFLKMHRVQATDPLGDGWQHAVSTEGGFSVELPLAFNDFRIRSETTDHVELRAHVIGAKTPGLLAWAATCMVRRDGKLSPDGRAPVSGHVEPKGTTAFQRTVEFDDASCVLVVEAQGTDPLPSAGDRDRFFQSMKRVAKPKW